MNDGIEYIKIERIYPHPENPRQDVGDVTELAESIKAQGVLQNLTVIPWLDVYPEKPAPAAGAVVVVIGHRRLAAAELAGLAELPCVVTTMDRKTQVSTMLLENMQRADLTIPEQAHGFQLMMDLGATVQEISEKTGFADRTVQRRLQIAKLPKKEADAAAGALRLEDYVAISQLEDPKDQKRVLKAAGTDNYKWELRKANERQKCRAGLNKVRPMLEAAGIEKYNGKDANPQWGNNTQIDSASLERIADGKSKLDLPENTEGVFWFADDNWIYILRKRSKKAEDTKPTKSPREIGADRKRAALKEVCERMYQSRFDFVRNFTAHKKYRDVIERQLIKGLLSSKFEYGSTDNDPLWAMIGKEPEKYKSPPFNEILAAVESEDGHGKLWVAWICSRENRGEIYNSGYMATPPDYDPEHWNLKKIKGVYAFLEELGYQLSDEERQMLDGTHPLYGKKKEKKDAAEKS